MLTPVSRFRFDKTYVYGSAAFIAGFGGVLTLLILFAPVRVNSDNIASITAAELAQMKMTTATETAAQSAETTEAAAPAATYNPVVNEEVTEKPADPGTPTDPVTPAEPASEPTPDPTPPIITVPIIDVPIPGVDLDASL